MGEAAGRLGVEPRGGGRCGQPGQDFCLQSQRTPHDRAGPERKYAAVLGRGHFRHGASPLHRARRFCVHDGRRRPYGPKVDRRRRVAPDPGDAQRTRREAQRRSVQHADGRRARTRRLNLRYRRLRQRPGAPLHAGWDSYPLLGRAGLRAGPVQNPSQHMCRRERSTICGRQGEQSHTGVFA